MIIHDDQLQQFIKSINKNAPLGDNYFYPYKPALIIAILKNIDYKNLFNKTINLNDSKILKEYYNLLTSDYVVHNKLSSLKTREYLNPQIGFNNNIKENLLKNISETAGIKLTIKNSNIWLYDKYENNVSINLNKQYSDYQLKEIKNLIWKQAVQTLYKCIPTWNKTIDLSSNIDYDLFIIQLLINNENQSNNSDIKQLRHSFSKSVKDRDQKCLICCERQPDLLFATHIKATRDCENEYEKYDCNNGITLCANHKILFDKYFFTFNQDWTIRVSKKFQNSDFYLKLKEFEKCFIDLKSSKTTEIQKFLEYRNKTYPLN